MNKQSSDKGVIYAATGGEYLQECVDSIRSLREHSQIPITLFTDRIPSDSISSITNLDVQTLRDTETVRPKLEACLRAPYSKNLYLDSDTYVMNSFEHLYDYVEGFDFVIGQTNYNNEYSGRIKRKFATVFDDYQDWRSACDITVPECMNEPIGGVFLFNATTDTFNLLSTWHNIFQKHAAQGYPQDQAALREALFHTDCSTYTGLPPRYGVSVRYLHGSSDLTRLLTKPPVIVHGRPHDIKRVATRLESQISRRGYRIRKNTRLLDALETGRLGLNMIRYDGVKRFCRMTWNYMIRR
jgi:hypothetical protein